MGAGTSPVSSLFDEFAPPHDKVVIGVDGLKADPRLVRRYLCVHVGQHVQGLIEPGPSVIIQGFVPRLSSGSSRSSGLSGIS